MINLKEGVTRRKYGIKKEYFVVLLVYLFIASNTTFCTYVYRTIVVNYSYVEYGVLSRKVGEATCLFIILLHSKSIFCEWDYYDVDFPSRIIGKYLFVHMGEIFLYDYDVYLTKRGRWGPLTSNPATYLQDVTWSWGQGKGRGPNQRKNQRNAPPPFR